VRRLTAGPCVLPSKKSFLFGMSTICCTPFQQLTQMRTAPRAVPRRMAAVRCAAANTKRELPASISRSTAALSRREIGYAAAAFTLTSLSSRSMDAHALGVRSPPSRGKRAHLTRTPWRALPRTGRESTVSPTLQTL
jgi:hypothetical protein